MSISVTGLCFALGYNFASSITSRTGAGYRPLILGAQFLDQSMSAFGSGLLHVDTFGSWSNFEDVGMFGTVLSSFVLYSVITPIDSLATNLTVMDQGGTSARWRVLFFSSLTPPSSSLRSLRS